MLFCQDVSVHSSCKGQKKAGDVWSWRYSKWLATIWVLEMKPGSSVIIPTAVNCGAVSLAPILFKIYFHKLIQKYCITFPFYLFIPSLHKSLLTSSC